MTDETYIDPLLGKFSGFQKPAARHADPHAQPVALPRRGRISRGSRARGQGLERGGGLTRNTARPAAPFSKRVGGSIVWRGRFETMVTGPEVRQWHDGFIARYPNAKPPFFAMIKDPDYQNAVVNRTAALVDSRPWCRVFAAGEAGRRGFGLAAPHSPPIAASAKERQFLTRAPEGSMLGPMAIAAPPFPQPARLAGPAWLARVGRVAVCFVAIFDGTLVDIGGRGPDTSWLH